MDDYSLHPVPIHMYIVIADDQFQIQVNKTYSVLNSIYERG